MICINTSAQTPKYVMSTCGRQKLHSFDSQWAELEFAVTAFSRHRQKERTGTLILKREIRAYSNIIHHNNRNIFKTSDADAMQI